MPNVEGIGGIVGGGHPENSLLACPTPRSQSITQESDAEVLWLVGERETGLLVRKSVVVFKSRRGQGNEKVKGFMEGRVVKK